MKLAKFLPSIGLILAIFYIYISGVFNHSIFTDKNISNQIISYQSQAYFLPYRLRPLLFTGTIYIYKAIDNTLNFFSLKTFYDFLLLANLYPFFLGFYISIKEFKTEDKIAFLGLLISTLAIGFNRSPDTTISLLPSVPIMLYLIIEGFRKVNLKVYLILLVISLFLKLGPIV